MQKVLSESVNNTEDSVRSVLRIHIISMYVTRTSETVFGSVSIMLDVTEA